jgi:hypothetical protein
MRSIRFVGLATLAGTVLAAALALGQGTVQKHSEVHTSSVFAGVKANVGTVKHMKDGDVHVLTLSSDFKVPDAPDPHWQVVDSKGNIYLLQRVAIKDNKVNTTIKLPSYIHDVKKVQMWCAFAEVLLGEASFDKPVM